MDGDIYSIDTKNAFCKQIGEEKSLFGALKYASDNNNLYMVDSFGYIYKIDITNGKKKKIKTTKTFSDVYYIFTTQKENEIVILEMSGALYSINIKDGTYKEIKILDSKYLQTTQQGVTINEILYTINVEGNLYYTDLNTGKWQRIGKPKTLLYNFFRKNYIKKIDNY